MIDFDRAIALIGEQATPIGSEQVALADAAGRVLAQDLVARSCAPRSAVSAMDGYAVIQASTMPGQWLELMGESRAGARLDGNLDAGQAARIFTGAPLPAGADYVIMQEYAERDGTRVRFAEGYGPAGHVRAAGSDFAEGALLVPAGTRLSPRAMIAAAAADVAEVSVACVPKVAIIGTGDELAPPGCAHEREDAIPESVSFGVAAMAESMGARITLRETAEDDLEALVAAAGRALEASDLVIVTGGASVGERDFAKPMFEAHGLDLIFNKVAIKPGKPVWLGRAGGKMVLGLPGNPTSAMVTAALFLRPVLAKLQGASIESVQCWRPMTIAAPLAATGSRETFVRARWEANGIAPVTNQDSGAQAALLKADWLIRCPANQAGLPAGAQVSALEF